MYLMALLTMFQSAWCRRRGSPSMTGAFFKPLPQIEDQLALRAEAAQVVEHGLDDGVEEHWLVGQFQAVGVDQGDVKDVLDDLAEAFHRLGDLDQEMTRRALVIFLRRGWPG